MEKIKFIHDKVGNTLTIWLGDPKQEAICDETTEEIVIMKDKAGKVLGFEILNYQTDKSGAVSIETIIQTTA